MKPVQFILIAFVVFALARVVRKYQKGGMRPGELLFWIALWSLTGLIVAFPDATSVIAHVLGIGRGADLIMYGALLGAYYLIFRVHLVIDRLEHAVTEVVRELALRERLPREEPR
jgi:hypothetical protein